MKKQLTWTVWIDSNPNWREPLFYFEYYRDPSTTLIWKPDTDSEEQYLSCAAFQLASTLAIF